jgi:hypothetical protein
MGQGGSNANKTDDEKKKHNNFVDFAPSVQSIKEKILSPIMFKWVYGGRKVFLTGSFSNWFYFLINARKPIQMNLVPDEEEDIFIIILKIEVGKHMYKVFIFFILVYC